MVAGKSLPSLISAVHLIVAHCPDNSVVAECDHLHRLTVPNGSASGEGTR